MTQVKRYDIFDIRLQGKAEKPFDTPLKARFIVLPSRHGYQIEIVDTWSMERRILDGEYQGVCEVPLEGKPYMAVFARKIRVTPL